MLTHSAEQISIDTMPMTAIEKELLDRISYVLATSEIVTPEVLSNLIEKPDGAEPDTSPNQ